MRRKNYFNLERAFLTLLFQPFFTYNQNHIWINSTCLHYIPSHIIYFHIESLAYRTTKHFIERVDSELKRRVSFQCENSREERISRSDVEGPRNRRLLALSKWKAIGGKGGTNWKVRHTISTLKDCSCVRTLWNKQIKTYKMRGN